ncbi:hypothetical protein CEXT_270831 [Caerostris extrusa]|uniref:Uncharacterized protein n=1 Tax=Caerostris extrusa TaxID=172846 RepID=A0AAV4MS67_CAEEX|nr:hypothetical protein CEXT_270831 [Caerostris extrusa]
MGLIKRRLQSLTRISDGLVGRGILILILNDDSRGLHSIGVKLDRYSSFRGVFLEMMDFPLIGTEDRVNGGTAIKLKFVAIIDADVNIFQDSAIERQRFVLKIFSILN